MLISFYYSIYDRFILGMERNTENGIQIFGKTIGIYSNSRFGRSCLCQFGRSCLCLGTGHIRILVTLQYIWSAESSIWGFYKLLRISLLVYSPRHAIEPFFVILDNSRYWGHLKALSQDARTAIYHDDILWYHIMKFRHNTRWRIHLLWWFYSHWIIRDKPSWPFYRCGVWTLCLHTSTFVFTRARVYRWVNLGKKYTTFCLDIPH